MSNHRLQNFATHRQGVPFSNEPRRRQAAHGRTQSSQSQSMGATPSIGYNQEPGTALNTPLYGPNTSSGSVLSGTGQGVRTTPTQMPNQLFRGFVMSVSPEGQETAIQQIVEARLEEAIAIPSDTSSTGSSSSNSASSQHEENELPRPYGCTAKECTKTFTRLRDLKRHQVRIHGWKVLKHYICNQEGCLEAEKKQPRRARFKKHIKTQHPDLGLDSTLKACTHPPT